MGTRTWSVQLNLDDLNAAWMALREPSEKADFLDGLTHGLNLTVAWAQGTPAYGEGFRLGCQARTATEEYRERQSKNGRLGGRPPKKTTGLAPLNRRFTEAEAMPKVSDSRFPVPPKEECTYGTRTPAASTGPAEDPTDWEGDDVPTLAQAANGWPR